MEVGDSYTVDDDKYSAHPSNKHVPYKINYHLPKFEITSMSKYLIQYTVPLKVVTAKKYFETHIMDKGIFADFINTCVLTKDIAFKVGDEYTVDKAEWIKQKHKDPLRIVTFKITGVSNTTLLLYITYTNGDFIADRPFHRVEFQDHVTTGLYVIKNTIKAQKSNLYCQGNCGIPSEIRYYGPMKFYNFCTKCRKEVL